MEFSEELLAAKRAALEAGSKAMEIYNAGASKVSFKEDKSEVTEADFASNELITERLDDFHHPLISEETAGSGAVGAEKTWVVDPLDGTMDFVRRTGEFSIMIGLLEKRKPVLGVVYVPVQAALYYAEKGKGAWVEKNGGKAEQISVSDKSSTSSFNIIVSKNHFTEQDAEFAKFLGAKHVSSKGSLGVKLAEIACGNAELYWNFQNLSIWDVCAPQALLEGAGGTVSDLQGKALDYGSRRLGTGFIATNGRANSALLSKFSEFMKKVK
ncbi:MAG: 3'(2'),5'-bisphosphate nucleotidase CysQ [Candidatus Micrarchaeia archaeon]|jgi:3'(2'), 5'-bisphosphate nucleotidase